jgi:hypothetical protein
MKGGTPICAGRALAKVGTMVARPRQGFLASLIKKAVCTAVYTPCLRWYLVGISCGNMFFNLFRNTNIEIRKDFAVDDEQARKVRKAGCFLFCFFPEIQLI